MAIIDPTAGQRSLLERHLDEMDRWNRRLNLTTVPRERAWERHVGESLALLGAGQLTPGTRCADLGSGGGVPGVVVAVLRPDVEVALIEADRRKAGFLVHLCGLLDLPNARVLDRRAEELGRDPGHRRNYHTVVSRAAAPPALLWALAEPLLAPDGSLWALVSAADGAAAEQALRADPRCRVRRPSPGILGVARVAG